MTGNTSARARGAAGPWGQTGRDRSLLPPPGHCPRPRSPLCLPSHFPRDLSAPASAHALAQAQEWNPGDALQRTKHVDHLSSESAAGFLPRAGLGGFEKRFSKSITQKGTVPVHAEQLLSNLQSRGTGTWSRARTASSAPRTRTCHLGAPSLDPMEPAPTRTTHAWSSLGSFQCLHWRTRIPLCAAV